MIIENNTTYYIRKSDTYMVVHEVVKEDGDKIIVYGTHKDKRDGFISTSQYHLLKSNITHWEKVK